MPAARSTSARLPRGIRAFSLPRRVAVRVLLGAALLAIAALGWTWLRDSSLVAVEDVTITGLSGSGSAPIRAALQSAAGDMTTLRVDRAALRTAVRAYPQVKDVRVSAHFLHRLDIEVVENNAVGAILAGGRRLPVAADGTLLRGTDPGAVATVQMATLPGGDQLTDRRAKHAIELLGAAPAPLRSRVLNAWSGARGLTARMRRGPLLFFGAGDRLAAKWAAVARVLADPSSAGALYLDVRVPERTAAGGLAEPPSEQPSTGG